MRPNNLIKGSKNKGVNNVNTNISDDYQSNNITNIKITSMDELNAQIERLKLLKEKMSQEETKKKKKGEIEITRVMRPQYIEFKNNKDKEIKLKNIKNKIINTNTKNILTGFEKKNINIKLIIKEPGTILVNHQCYPYNEDEKLYQVLINLSNIEDKYIHIHKIKHHTNNNEEINKALSNRIKIEIPMKKNGTYMYIFAYGKLDKLDNRNIIECFYHLQKK